MQHLPPSFAVLFCFIPLCCHRRPRPRRHNHPLLFLLFYVLGILGRDFYYS